MSHSLPRGLGVPRLYCVIGHPVAHSLSPKLHNEAFRKRRLPFCYEAVDVSPRNLGHFMKEFRQKYAGANVTIPHKEAVIKYLDRLSPEAESIGAVNTIVNKNGVLIGHNTDVYGALYALQKIGRIRLKGKRVVVLGAGGASRAIVYGLTKAGAKVVILNRTLSNSKKLGHVFGAEYGPIADFQNHACDILINTTSVGMWPEVKGTPLSRLQSVLNMQGKKPLVADIIYRPRMTKLLRDAKKAGCKVVTGDHMFRAQAAKSFELWTGLSFP